MKTECLREIYPAETVELMEKYLSGMRDSKEVSSRVNTYADFFAVTGEDLMRAGRGTLLRYLSDLESRVDRGSMKHSTALKKRKFIAAFLSWCEKEKESGNRLVPDSFANLMLTIKAGPEDDIIRLQDMPDLTELDRLFGYLKENDRQVLCAVALAIKCLLKTGEIAALRNDQIVTDMNGKMFLLPEGFTMPVSVPEDISNILGETVAGSGQKGWLFPSPVKNAPLNVSNIQRRLSKACAMAGVRRMTLNSLRNMAAVMAVSGGADAVKLNDDMGYRSRTHIRRLTSLPLRYSDSGERYVHLVYRT